MVTKKCISVSYLEQLFLKIEHRSCTSVSTCHCPTVLTIQRERRHVESLYRKMSTDGIRLDAIEKLCSHGGSFSTVHKRKSTKRDKGNESWIKSEHGKLDRRLRHLAVSIDALQNTFSKRTESKSLNIKAVRLLSIFSYILYFRFIMYGLSLSNFILKFS